MNHHSTPTTPKEVAEFIATDDPAGLGGTSNRQAQARKRTCHLLGRDTGHEVWKHGIALHIDDIGTMAAAS